MYKHFGKRVIDVIIALCGIVVLIIPMGIIAVLIKLDSPGPAIFKQKRTGIKQKIFTVYKFRTMCDHAYEKGGIATSESDNRITKVGKVLRRISLDGDDIIGQIRKDLENRGFREVSPMNFLDNHTRFGWYSCDMRIATV